MQEPPIHKSWQAFLPLFANQILPIYQKHETGFDFFGYHGRRHLTRSLIFAEMMARFYINRENPRSISTGFVLPYLFTIRDVRVNGRDYWEGGKQRELPELFVEIGEIINLRTKDCQNNSL